MSSTLKGVLVFPKEASKKKKEAIVKELINRRRHQLIVHSIIYYRLNDNIISDSQWDLWARQLVELQERFPNTSKKVTKFYDKFRDFDASTGFHLCAIENEDMAGMLSVAQSLLANRSKSSKSAIKKKRKRDRGERN